MRDIIKKEGATRWRNDNENFTSIDMYRNGERLLETEFDLKKEITDAPKHRVLFNKKQWKKACKAKWSTRGHFVGYFSTIRD